MKTRVRITRGRRAGMIGFTAGDLRRARGVTKCVVWFDNDEFGIYEISALEVCGPDNQGELPL